MISLPSGVISDRELGVLEALVWFALLYVLILMVITAYRKFIRDGDVITEANKVLEENESIDTYLTDWMGITPKTTVEEVRALDAERAPSAGRLGASA